MTEAPAPDLWRVTLTVAAKDVEGVATALENHCDTVAWFEDEAAGTWRLEGWATARPDPAAIAAALGTGVAGITVEPVAQRDWLADNLRAFPPIAAGRFFIHGSHFDGAVPAGKVALLIDSATAFGSGEHASTAGCLRALDGLARRRFGRVLDMGCGSGILALAAAKVWRVPVLAADIDPESVRVAALNAARNGVAPLVRAVASAGYRHRAVAAGGPYDLILANILARPLRAMAGDLARHLAPGGVAVLSGFLARDENLVLGPHRARGLVPARRITIDGWRTLVLHQP
ncbi:MAG: 50S ribosomal protein L11 methyltransferase [Hyphomicrobiales bacterium]|nr:50S ribosomal protein L11 methyltransferase [Hyphomicrobiales bacterium]MCP5373381.1 50S ribosomal protein L11 methyltransferase [Hyphomicrobiales bacterium]